MTSRLSSFEESSKNLSRASSKSDVGAGISSGAGGGGSVCGGLVRGGLSGVGLVCEFFWEEDRIYPKENQGIPCLYEQREFR